ncbi:hypothetical protein C8J56DRAFT_790114 [Mycena floridula]|nr:hypothetical protein C8J56DRAFT_790114 [Mycena floridula]
MGPPSDAHKIDDSDPSIVYSSDDWITAGSSHEFQSTTHETRIANATATIEFFGAFIQVYGTIPPYQPDVPSPISNYSVDGAIPTTFAPKLTNTSTSAMYQQQFFASPTLANGNHTLVITSVSNGGRLYLDFVSYDLSRASSGSTTSSSTSLVFHRAVFP